MTAAPLSAAGPAIPATGPDATDVYALGSNPTESARLQRQSDELRPQSIALLRRLGLGPGQSAIDLGCGPSGILDLLSDAVSPGGRVVGLDDPRLTSGWHDNEAGEGEGAAPGWRWTDGDAGLDLPGVRILEIDIAMTERYWVGRDTNPHLLQTG